MRPLEMVVSNKKVFFMSHPEPVEGQGIKLSASTTPAPFDKLRVRGLFDQSAAGFVQ